MQGFDQIRTSIDNVVKSDKNFVISIIIDTDNEDTFVSLVYNK